MERLYILQSMVGTQTDTQTQAETQARSKRAAGMVLHLSSLPSRHGIGDMGLDAYSWVSMLSEIGIKLWQVLPLNPVGYGNSPYMPSSSFAGNPLFISLDKLAEEGLLPADELDSYPNNLAQSRGADVIEDLHRVDYEAVAAYKMPLIKQAAATAIALGFASTDAYQTFEKTHAYWLNDYACFAVATEVYGSSWRAWPEPLRSRTRSALADFEREQSMDIAITKMVQYFFFSQWVSLKAFANGKGVRIMGDLPIFPSIDSAELWAHPEYFDLDENYEMLHVAGCPPDGYSAVGQKWGNPMYRWEVLRSDSYSWWLERMQTLSCLVDVLRIDHFRGFEAAWQIPADAEDARTGKWIAGPKMHFFDAVKQAVPQLEIVAEDLGFLTEGVMALLRDTGFAGMRVMHFAFEYGSDGLNTDNIYLPHHVGENSLYYTGTHDSETTRGWYDHLSDDMRAMVRDYLGRGDEGMVWHIIRSVLSSRARYALLPLQDMLEQDNSFRMNIPATPSGNWEYRFIWSEIEPWRKDLLHKLIKLYGRL